MPKPNFKDRNSEIYYPLEKKSAASLSPTAPEKPLSAESQGESFPLVTWSDPFGEGLRKQLHPYYGVVSGNYYAMTGMPWLSSDARKAVKTEWFWQPIRGQPRRVDTNELRKYANTVWVQSITMTIIKQATNVPWDIVPIDEEMPYENVRGEIERVKEFFDHPNENDESWADLTAAWIKDIEEIDAGVLVKVFTVDSYDFEHLEPRSGAPLLKPLVCPECLGERKINPGLAQGKAFRVMAAIAKAEEDLPDSYEKTFEDGTKTSKETYKLLKPDYEPIKEKMMQVVSGNSPFDENAVEYDCPFCSGNGTGRQLKEIYCFDGASFLKDSDRTGWTYGYWQYSYAIPAHPMWFNREEIIYYSANPRGFSVYGYSPMQSSLELVKSLEYSVRHNMALFLDGAVPDGIVGIEDMSNVELKRMKTEWENELKGQPHKVLFLNKKTSFSPFAFNNRDMQFLEGQKQTWLQVMANFGVGPVDLGIFEDVNRATAGTGAELGRRKAIRPILKKMEDMINRQILPELGVSRVKFSYIVDDPVEERMKAELNEIYIRSGQRSLNEIRIEDGLPPVSWGDGPSNPLQAIGFASQGQAKPGEVEGIQDTEDSAENAPDDAKEKKARQPPIMGSQTPHLTRIQNLSSGLGQESHLHGHPNSQYPYSAMAGMCPGCGRMGLVAVGESPDMVSIGRWYVCNYCNRTFTEEALATATSEQNSMHSRGERTDPYKRTQDINEEAIDALAKPGATAPTAPLPNLVVEGKPRKKKAIVELKKKIEAAGPVFLDVWVGFETAPLFAFVSQYLNQYFFEKITGTKKQKLQLAEIFAEAFSSGMNMRQLSGEIESAGFGPDNADMIARTETIKIANEAKLLQAEANGYDEVVFVATHDKFTCKECSSLDGKKITVRKAKGLIPVHPNCRCTYRMVVNI